MLPEFKDRMKNVKGKPLRQLGRFKVGDVVYPVYHRHLLHWGTIVAIDDTIRCIDVDFNGEVLRFQPDWLVHTNPTLAKSTKNKKASAKPKLAVYYKEKPSMYKRSLEEENKGVFRCPKCKHNMVTSFDDESRATVLICNRCDRKLNMKNIVSKVVLDDKVFHAKTKKTVIDYIHKLVGNSLKGLFKDDYWLPVQELFETIRGTGIDLTVDVRDGGYSPDRRSKTWHLTLEWTNGYGKSFVQKGIVVASGAGSEDDPLSSYDISFYFH